MVNDPIADYLTRIRNAQQRLKEAIEVPSTNILVEISKILKEEGFIEDYEMVEDDSRTRLVVKLKYVNNVPAIRELVRVSKPGVRKYRGYKEIKPIMNGLGVSIFSTPKGVVSGTSAVKSKVGGEFLCYVY